MAQFLKKVEAGSGQAKELAGLAIQEVDEAFAKKYPALAEFLGLELWEDGTERERGTVTVFFEEGSFKASLNDRDAQRVAFVTKKTFTGLLEALEKGIVGGSHDWRKWRATKPSKGKRG